ncbi:ureidoglycolate lyase [Shigella flexneri]
MKLQVLPLSQEAFSAYGDVIETQQRDFFHINNGLVERYHDLALVEILEQDRTLISINRAQPANLPLTIHELERHPLGTQAFIPMKGEVFVVVVALGDDKPDLSTLRAFITNGEQLFAWQRVTDFLTIDRGGSDNCDVESIPEQELCFA